MSEMVTIRAACAATGLPRQRLFQLLLRKQLGYRQVEPDGPYLIDRAEVERVRETGLAWARQWGERWEARHPDGSRVDRLEDWST